ncbi:uncharacterized protein A4U43_C04F18500 [Asparagus officinalis]|uniref:Uncharacterized protein n=1 Tax=Asparagus officinalis TaxID=4686 RepID=A0A5P1F6J7_ASPOF|nr:uncharacterized protein A4U43_C04F18500 [Asparagus officinalis]
MSGDQEGGPTIRDAFSQGVVGLGKVPSLQGVVALGESIQQCCPPHRSISFALASRWTFFMLRCSQLMINRGPRKKKKKKTSSKGPHHAESSTQELHGLGEGATDAAPGSTKGVTAPKSSYPPPQFSKVEGDSPHLIPKEELGRVIFLLWSQQKVKLQPQLQLKKCRLDGRRNRPNWERGLGHLEDPVRPLLLRIPFVEAYERTTLSDLCPLTWEGMCSVLMDPKSCPRYEGESEERPFILKHRMDAGGLVLESRVNGDKALEYYLLPADEALLSEIPNAGLHYALWSYFT